jgi:tight adherence protein G
MPSPISLMSKQSGNAAILFALMIPILFGIFILASDGARALQSKARLDDALEAASLAVAADDNEDSNLANAYVEQYMTDISSPPKIKVETSTAINEKGLPILEYRLSASTTHKSWFPGNSEIQGFGESFTVSGDSLVKRYQSDDIDVIFAADFSSSMKRALGRSKKPKYKDVLEIIGEVTDVLAEFNDKNDSKNTASFTAFNIYTNKFVNPPLKTSPQWPIPLFFTTWCYVDERIYDPFLLFNKINYEKIISNIFIPKEYCRITIADHSVYHTYPDFYDVESRDFDDKTNRSGEIVKSTLEQFKYAIQDFEPIGGTASYQGIIRAAQLAVKGSNTRRLIIVLSDGTDSQNGWISEYDTIFKTKSNHAHYTEELVKEGMCDTIRDTLNKQTADNGRDVTSKIVVIGFGYQTGTNNGLRECTKENGKYNVYEANNREAIKRKILELISEEIGHLS